MGKKHKSKPTTAVINQVVVEKTNPEDGRLERTCKRCNKPFSISSSEQKWLKDHNLEFFTHCKTCRAARKAERAATATDAVASVKVAPLEEAAAHIDAAAKAVTTMSKRASGFASYLKSEPSTYNGK